MVFYSSSDQLTGKLLTSPPLRVAGPLQSIKDNGIQVITTVGVTDNAATLTILQTIHLKKLFSKWKPLLLERCWIPKYTPLWVLYPRRCGQIPTNEHRNPKHKQFGPRMHRLSGTEDTECKYFLRSPQNFQNIPKWQSSINQDLAPHIKAIGSPSSVLRWRICKLCKHDFEGVLWIF